MARVVAFAREHDVARRGDRLGEVGKALLGPEGDNDLAVRVEIDPEAALVISRLGLSEARNAAAGGIAVRVGLGRHFGKLGDDMLRRGAIGIAHAEIDDVFSARSSRGLHRIHLREDVGRQALDAIEFVDHRASMAAMLQCGKLVAIGR